MPTDDADSTVRAISREHVLGATVWAFGAGGARVRPWTQLEDFTKFWRIAGQ